MQKLMDVGGLVLVLVMLGCGANVVVADDDGAGGAGAGTVGIGAGSEGASDEGAGNQGGGGGISGPRSIEVALEAYPGQSLEGIWVLVNDVSGGLRQQIPATELPTQVEVEDGDLITYAVPPDTQSLLLSYRVNPGVTRVDHSIMGPSSPSCDGDPMLVTVTIPEVEGAFDYWVFTNTYAAAGGMAPGERTLHVHSCTDTFDLLAYARSGPIIAYELLRDIPFEPGGEATVELTLPSTQRSSFTLEIDGLEGVESLSGESDWQRPPAMYPHEAGNLLDVDSPSGTVQYEVSTIDPGPGYGMPRTTISAWFSPGEDGMCDFARASLFGASDGQVSIGKLATVRELSDGSLVLGEGAHGDIVLRNRADSEAANYVWSTAEDPASLAWPAPMIELPPEVAWTDQPLEIYSLGHEDSGAGGYAAAIGATAPQPPAQTMIRVSEPCSSSN